jgi:hypothetical protein
MKYKLTLFSLAFFLLLISLSLVYAFESEVYQIGIEVPQTDDTSEEVTPTNGNAPSGGGSSPSKDTPAFTLLSTGTWQENGEETGEEIILEEPSEKKFFSRLTGAIIGGVTDFAKTTTRPIALVVLIGGLTLFIVIRKRGLKKNSKPQATQELFDSQNQLNN